MCVRTNHFVYGAVERVVLGEDEEDDEGHVNMVGVSVLDMIEDLQNWYHLLRREREIIKSTTSPLEADYFSVFTHQ